MQIKPLRIHSAPNRSPKRVLPILPVLVVAMTAAGCTSVPMKESGTLTSYSSLGPAKGKLSEKQRLYVDGQHLSRVKTVRIVPTSFTFIAANRVKSESDRSLVANALDRALCVALSDKYRMVRHDQRADLTVRSVVTDIVLTNKDVAAAATVVSVGGGFAIPDNIPIIGVPRIPFGLGGLAVEAEALDGQNIQRAAMMWTRGANFIQDKPRYSEVGDAYGHAAKFASDFSQLLITGREPRMFDVSVPAWHQVQSWFGGKPKYAACETFGRAPGVMGAVATKFGLPPQWTDKKPKALASR
ncbi:hypothetical protein GGR03_004490 [Aurantimonas endophytica]|uniref:DUF3313 domain-containing protein n=2 Tax=Aurantimonas endophytica TaxID=1522175 RepID=A0A7W6HHL8_9HYPH|nr:hypothetical protein [Aurantimonas endophytica]